jgi:cytochrome c
MKTGAALLVWAVLSACDRRTDVIPGISGDAQRGPLLLRQYGCGSCHQIKGVAAADGKVGPPLNDIARRAYLGGVLPNTPQNMVRWIRDPRSIDPKTAMPDMQVPQAHAEDMVAYLYTLR